jgi:hypothetical protein
MKWRKLHNVELIHNLYSSGNIIRTIKTRRMRWAGTVARLGERRNARRIFVGKPVRKTLPRRPRYNNNNNNNNNNNSIQFVFICMQT